MARHMPQLVPPVVPLRDHALEFGDLVIRRCGRKRPMPISTPCSWIVDFRSTF
jgi:hypothetical protein